MSAQAELLDKARECCSLPSDNALSGRMGVSRAIVSEWRSGAKTIPDARIAQLCALAKSDGATWLARIHIERATDAAERKLWASMLDRLRPIAAAVGLVAVGTAWSGAADASNVRVSAPENAQGIYIMRSRRLLSARVLSLAIPTISSSHRSGSLSS